MKIQCPSVSLGEICEHQGGTFNTFELEDHSDNR